LTLRVVFMGTPEFAVPTLKALHANFKVIGVVTQPDRPRGRGLKSVATEVKKAAVELCLPVIEPERPGSPETQALLEEWAPDVIVVAAYGKILPEAVLKLPPLGCINLHGSILPRHRGASPISAAILAGDTITGVTTMLMDRGTDTGQILMTSEIPLSEDETAGTLHDKLMEPGADLVVETLKRLREGSIVPRPQDDSKATICKPLSREDGQLDWALDAEHLSRLVRAYNPAPGAFFDLSGQRVKVWEARSEEGHGEPGRITEIMSDGTAVGTGKGLLVLGQVQAPAKKRISGADFVRGRRLKKGDFLR